MKPCSGSPPACARERQLLCSTNRAMCLCVLETNNPEQLIFKHAISTVAMGMGRKFRSDSNN